MNNAIKKYKYQGKWWSIILGLVMFGGTMVLFYNKAMYNDRGLILNGIIELSENGATIFYGVLFVFSLLFVLGAIYGIYFKLKKPVYLTLDDKKIVLPPVGIQRQTRTILYADIISLEETKVSGQHILTIYTQQGKKGAVLRSMLPKKADYEEVKAFLNQKLVHS